MKILMCNRCPLLKTYCTVIGFLLYLVDNERCCLSSRSSLTSASETIRKPPLVKAQTALRKQKNMAKNDFQYGRWNSYTLQCGTIMTLISPMWHMALGSWQWIHQVAVILPATWNVALGWHVIEFTRWQHPAMWHVALESWQWIRPVAAPAMWHVALGSWHSICQVAALCNVADGSGMAYHWICPNVCHIGILLSVSISDISPQSTCHSAPVCGVLSKSDHPRQKKRTSRSLRSLLQHLNCRIFRNLSSSYLLVQNNIWPVTFLDTESSASQHWHTNISS